MLAVAAAPSRAGLASSARRAAQPLRCTSLTRPRPARRLCCQPVAACKSWADVLAQALVVPVPVVIIGLPLSQGGIKIARRLLPRMAEQQDRVQPLEQVVNAYVIMTLCGMAAAAESAWLGIYQALFCCLTGPTLWLLTMGLAERLKSLPELQVDLELDGTAWQDDADDDD